MPSLQPRTLPLPAAFRHGSRRGRNSAGDSEALSLPVPPARPAPVLPVPVRPVPARPGLRHAEQVR